MNRNMLGLLAVAGLGVGGLAWAEWPTAQSQPQTGMLPYLDRAVTAQGAKIYADNCASCHGGDLKGQPDWRRPDADGYLPAPPHDPSGHTWHHPDALLIQITQLGTEAMVGGNYRSRMVGFGGILSEQEIIAVLAYIKSTWPAKVIDQHNRINADAAETRT